MAKNVLMIGWELPPFNSGGLGEACLGLSKALAKKGTNVTFVLPQKVDLHFDFMNLVFANVAEEGTDLVNEAYQSYEVWVKGKKFKIKDAPSGYVAGALKYAKRIKEIAQKAVPDIIHSHDWFTFPAGIAAKEATNAPFVAQVHSTEIDRTGGNSPNQTVFEIEKLGVQSADKVIAISQMQRNILNTSYDVSPEKIEVVYNGASFFEKEKLPPTLEFYKSAGYKIVLFLGRITLMKGPEYFVRAAKRILDYEKKVIFVVVGNGDMFSQMLSEAVNLGIMNNFIFTGFLQGEDKHRIYQTADIYLMPSVSEPFGLTVLESIGNGTPVLLSKQSGVSEIVSNVLKTDFWDIDEIANKVISAIRYPALLTVLKDESKKELPNISWDRSADKCLHVYQDLAQ
ncbi:MAG: Glycosyltransferase [Microgenomates group bacterium GW2011_GWC1_37_12b]|uniref:Glycosyltransferase n=1 Tax=Candidatus Woesebacteria bacterium GW2011_GWB1_38_8b TaxID=1618571 RepID=A0A0G0LI58_9BACT|nr:MAG: Glycosyltransferase [Microgenomates group bacterium GW2011_GWC1_37_12b]KKQ87600.1 MAG: Glycosyltransferase [Candidatus Woesebacteria bacterium GW2011_GWB1_38_8b]